MEVTYIKLFVDYLDAIEPLADAERGRLLTALLIYARTGESVDLSGNERYVFPMMRAQIDRDRAAVKEIEDSRRAAGRKGGLSSVSSKKKQNKANASKQSKDKEEDQDKDQDKDQDQDKENINIARQAEQIISFLNENAGTSYKATSKATQRLISARLNDGFTVQDFFTVIEKRCRKWLKDPKMAQYLRPQTLFGTKFEGYLNSPEGGENGNVGERFSDGPSWGTTV